MFDARQRGGGLGGLDVAHENVIKYFPRTKARGSQVVLIVFPRPTGHIDTD